MTLATCFVKPRERKVSPVSAPFRGVAVLLLGYPGTLAWAEEWQHLRCEKEGYETASPHLPIFALTRFLPALRGYATAGRLL